MNDHEMLNFAAKAAGHPKDFQWNVYWLSSAGGSVKKNNSWVCWNPLTDDGDALRLAVQVLNWPHGGRAFNNAVTAMSAVGKLPADPYAATRRAIVRAAAEIGRAMP